VTADFDKALSELSDMAREVYDYLSKGANLAEGNPLPKTVIMSDELNMSRRMVQDALAELGESGLLTISRVYKIESLKEGGTQEV
jgi:DNA-binding FadR family transcriptional regulator